MSTAPLSRAGPLLLVLGSACAAPIGKLLGFTLTGDRALGLMALGLLGVLAVRRRVHWTVVHTALTAGVAAQVLTTTLNASTWSEGPRFVTVYLLGFACFALAAEWARGAEGERRTAWSWIAVGTVLAPAGAVLADLANVWQRPLWGTGAAQMLFWGTEHERLFFAARMTFGEWNLFSSFLLIPFTLGLWAWRRDAGDRPVLLAALAAMLLGLVAGATRAAWLSVAGILVAWYALTRPRRRQVAAIGLILAAVLLIQVAILGVTPLWSRLVERRSMAGRASLAQVTIASWSERPLLGHGAGSSNRLSVGGPTRRPAEKPWNSNLVLFVLEDSGLLGLATLLGLAVVVVRRAARAIGSETGGATSRVAVPLLVSGVALGFSYQFTHALWLMYPYVYLGFLTAATESASDREAAATISSR